MQWWTWIWVVPVIGVAAVLALWVAGIALLVVLGIASALFDLVYSLLVHGRFVESERTRRLLDF